LNLSTLELEDFPDCLAEIYTLKKGMLESAKSDLIA